MNTPRQYLDPVLVSLQAIYGKGFMSPGGVEEVRRICAGLDLERARVLDLGCGLGGATVALAGTLGAGAVIALDIEAGNIEHTRRALEEAGLGDRVELVLAEPGPLPLPGASVDLVFCKAVACHMANKAAFFADARKVLRAGGHMIGADWMVGQDDPASPAWTAFMADLDASGLRFRFETAQAHEDAFRQAGFDAVTFEDVSEDTRKECRSTLSDIEGPMRGDLIGAMGVAGYEGFLTRCRARIDALENGDLEYRIFRARAA